MAATLEPAPAALSPTLSPREKESGAAPTGRLTLALLGAILLLALGLRLWGLSWGLPWAFHPDEIFYVDQAEDIVRFGDLNPKYFKNPSALTYLIAGELVAARALGLGGPGLPYLLARLDSALIGTASVGLVFALGARLFDRRIGLLAALFLALSFLHVRDSHYGVNDVPGTGLLLASLYCCARILQGGSARWYLLAGFLGGLATSTKYNMGFFFVPIVVAHVFALRDSGAGGGGDGMSPVSPHPPISPSPHLPLILAGLASLVAYLLGTPYTLLDFGRFQRDFLTQYHFGDNRWLGQPLEPVPLLYLTSLLQGFGALPLGLALIGLGLALRRRRAAALLLVAFPIVYLAFLMRKELFFPRFTMPLLPSLALLAAYGLVGLASMVSTARVRAAVLAAVLVAALLQPASNVLRHNLIISRADTRVLANEWVQANLPPGSRLKIEDYSLRDLSTQSRTYTPNTADLKIERMEGSPEAEQARAFYDKNVQYVVTSSFAYERYLLEPPTPGQRETGERYRRLHRSLENRAELIARFSPGWGNGEVPYRLDDVLTPFWSLEEYERPGPTIRIYSLAPLANP